MRKVQSKLLNIGVALVFASTLLIAAHSPISAHQSSASLPTLRMNALIFETQWTHTMDPAFVSDSTSYFILSMNQANLVKQLPNGKIVPYLATWKMSANRKVYTFTLRPNLRFSNGDPVTAQDAAYSITRSLLKATNSPLGTTYDGHIVGAANAYAGKTNKLAGLKVLNSRELQVTLDKPISFFLAALTYPTNDVLDQKVISGKKPDTYMTNDCSANVGAGPFKLVCRNNSTNKSSFYPSGSTPTITMEPNPYYYGRKPHFKAVMPVLATDVVNYRDYKAGGIDMTVIPSADIAKEKKTPGFLEFETSALFYLTPNETSAPFNNEHCRLAVSYAIDRDTINNKVWHGAQKTVYSFIPKGMHGYYSGSDNPHYNPAKARQELAQCPGGIHNVQFPYPTGSTDEDNQASILSSMWSAVGIDLKPKPITLNAWYDLVGKPLSETSTAITKNGWIMDYNDPQDYTTVLNRSDASYNIGGFKNAQFDKITDQAEVTPNGSKRWKLYQQAQHLLLGTGAQIMIGQGVSPYLIKPTVHGFVGSLQGIWPKDSDWANVTVK